MTEHDHDHGDHDHETRARAPRARPPRARAGRVHRRGRGLPPRQGRVLQDPRPQPDPRGGARGLHRPAVLPGRRGAPVRGPDSSSRTPARSRRTSRSRRRTASSGRPIGPASSAFELDDAPYQLTAYTFDGGDGESLFVPFLDATSGTETYGAGRYLDLEPEEDGTYALDFNLAYHPSCVYDVEFSCPLTPAENRLSRRIEAGERLPDEVEA